MATTLGQDYDFLDDTTTVAPPFAALGVVSV
jgi:hypothetical protein